MNTTTQSNEKPAQPVVLPVDLRDYFAAKAMQSFVQGARALDTLSEGDIKRQFDLVGDFAYRMADSMLKAREAQQ